MKRYYLLITLSVAFALVVYYLVTSLSFIEKDKAQHYTFLVRSKVSYQNASSSANGQNAINENLTLIFYWYPKPYFLIFSIPPGLYYEKNNTFNSLNNASNFQLKQTLQEMYGFSIDFIATQSTETLNNFLDLLGGTTYFNLHSNAMEKGEIYLEQKTLNAFLNGIENPFRKEDAIKGVWLTLLEKFRNLTIKEYHFSKKLKELHRHLNFNMNYGTFKILARPLLNLPEDKELFVTAMRANLMKASSQKLGNIDIPYKKGSYDNARIKEILNDFKNNLPESKLFPIVMQLRNTTSISRLAVRTAGVLRLKRIDALEYLNSSIKINRSVLLNYAHSPIKTKYVKRHTKVGAVYKMFDYRENFDFTLFIGEDFYAVKLIK